MTSTLDSRRDKVTAATTAAEQAEEGVAQLDHRLQANATLAKQQKQVLRNAKAEIARLKLALTGIEQEKAQLTTARKKAVARAKRARNKREKAEAKYDRLLLADIVRREKERHSDQEFAAASSAAGPSRTVVPDPPPEQPDPATTTAVRTAARTTATAAAR